MQRIIGTYEIDGKIIEYSIWGESGEPILVMHGGHSSCYEEFGYSPLIDNSFRIITPSRAGYGKTSKEIGESLSIACDYYVKLLDYLGIAKVHLLAMSAGGPTGLYFASHYPNRVKTLTLQSAVTKEWHTPKDKIYRLAQILFNPYVEKATWKLTSMISNLFPKFMFKQMVPSFSNLSYKQIKEKMVDEDIEEIQKMISRQRSGHGFLIDLLQTKEITAKDLKDITCPTLIMHSEFDSTVPLEHPHYAHELISDSELCMLESWGHLIWLGQEVKGSSRKLVDFLTSYSMAS